MEEYTEGLYSVDQRWPLANLFLREGRLMFFKHGAGRTIESQPKFQNSSLFLAYLYF